MINKYFCLHGHFYQPPRENPSLNIIEPQKSAFPFNDWNERITEECYYPNAFAGIYSENKIIKILNNYEYMSFNFGPTLLSWLEQHSVLTYNRILEADIKSRQRFNGHGNAIAQVYNHIIMPLATTRDKIIQIEWGLKDFEKRFNRAAEGMWLAETAADNETLELLADYGIKFTILSPYQAKAILENNNWFNKTAETLDFRKPYKLRFSNNREIIIIFYEAELSKAVAFENLLTDAHIFMDRISAKFYDSRDLQLLTIATDGETYGHHKKFGELALSYLFDNIEALKNIKICNIPYFLELYNSEIPEVNIHEKSAWSCAHGVGRWSGVCGCKIAHDNWNQKWRYHLRKAMNVLKEKIDILFDEQLAELTNLEPHEIFKLLADYGNLISLTPTEYMKQIPKFLEEYKITKNKDKIIKLLEIQKNALFMFTSCGWFFDDISGIEAQQILRYAMFAIRLSADYFDVDLEKEFIDILSAANSNLEEYGTGEDIYNNYIKKDFYEETLIAAVASALTLYNFEKKKKFNLYFYNVEILEIIKKKKSDEKIEYLLSLQAQYSLNKNTYQIICARTETFSETYKVIRIKDKTKFSEEIEYSFFQFPSDIRIKLLRANIFNHLSEYYPKFKKFYKQIDLYKKHIENPDIYLPPIVQAIIKEILYQKLVKAIDDADIETLDKLATNAEIWNVQYITRHIHEIARTTLTREYRSIFDNFDYSDQTNNRLENLIKLINNYKKLNLNYQPLDLQADFLNFCNENTEMLDNLPSAFRSAFAEFKTKFLKRSF